MDVKGLVYNSSRAHKARLAVVLTKPWLVVLMVCMASLVISGGILIALGWAMGWALLSCSFIPAMVVEWYNGELAQLVALKHVKQIDDIIAGEILGELPYQPSPYDLATLIGRVRGGQFFAARFGIGTGFLQQIASKDSKDMDSVWQEAVKVRQQTGSPLVSAGVLVVALLRSFGNYETLLAHLQLDEADLLDGIAWYDHIQHLIASSGIKRRTGGIARDWSFGWIPLLSRFGQNISEQMSVSGGNMLRLEAHQDSLDQLIHVFEAGGRKNAVLVGPTGVGKAEIIYSFASTLLDGDAKISGSLKFRQVFMLDASSLISAASGKGEIETLINHILGEAYSAKNIIVCLENAQLFFEEGVGSIDITNILLPILEAGKLPIMMTMDEQRYLEITKRNPALTNATQRISVGPTGQPETMAIMQDQLITLEFQYNVTYMYQALKEAYRLSERYVYDLAMPGRALNLLESAAHYADGGLVTAKSVQQAIEQTVGVKISIADDETERSTLINLEELIHERMINQSRAVSVVSDAIRRARTGVRNQNRPIGTFLFLGPTGVGKTELAKSLAAVYFGGEDRLIRLDMNEYVSANDVKRLIADGATDPGSLTARVMKQPFSVILLDEIEKAHDSVLTTLLQLLDEGILRDINNREVSFKDAIIIATSNAGADRIREYIERGYDAAQFEDQFVDELISSNQFRAEFLNRFDEIVVFSPLTKEELVQVVDLILVGVNKTLALQKISVHVEDNAKLYLVDAGYDPRLGARPMRRVVQRAVENTVAKLMLGGGVEPGSTIEIKLDQVRKILGSVAEARTIINQSSKD